MSEHRNLSLTDITEPTEAARAKIDPNGIIELASSMKRLGLLQPILVRKKGDKYEIEAGHRRFLAASMLNWGTIEAKILDSTDEDTMHLERAHENLVRENLNPIDEARLVYKMVYEDGRGVDQTAKLLSKATSWIENRMDILKWPENIKEEIELGHITLSVGKELAKVKDDDTRSRLLESTIAYGASAKVVKQWVEDLSVDRFLQEKEINTDIGENISTAITGVSMECRICGTLQEINKLRHIWLCPDCLMGIRELARETRNEILKNREQQEQNT